MSGRCRCGSETDRVGSRYSRKDGTVVLRHECPECNRTRCARWRRNNPGRMYEIVRRSTLRQPHKQRARMAVHQAVMSGRLQRPFFCPVCSLTARVEAHHSDYSRPLDVLWMCRQCHARLHREPIINSE